MRSHSAAHNGAWVPPNLSQLLRSLGVGSPSPITFRRERRIPRKWRAIGTFCALSETPCCPSSARAWGMGPPNPILSQFRPSLGDGTPTGFGAQQEGDRRGSGYSGMSPKGMSVRSSRPLLSNHEIPKNISVRS